MSTVEVTTVQGSRLTDQIEVPSELKELTDLAQLPPNHRMFRILTRTDGDKRFTWDSMVLDEIRAAKKFFDDMVGKGMVPFRVDAKGKKTTEAMREFDPTAEEVIFAPIAAMVGG